MKIIYLLFFFISTFSLSQTNEWMVLKKKDYNIKTYFPGKYIRFELDNYQWIEGTIQLFKNDSIFLLQQSERILVNAWGLPVRDTVTYGILAYRIKEIYALPLEQPSNIFTNGTLLQILGGGYIILNAANSAILNQAFFTAENLTGIGIAAGVFTAGKLIQLSHPTKIKLGKKYHLQNIKMNLPN